VFDSRSDPLAALSADETVAAAVLAAREEVDALLRVSAPMLDVYTDGLFTDSRIRDQWQPSSQEDS